MAGKCAKKFNPISHPVFLLYFFNIFQINVKAMKLTDSRSRRTAAF
jgi:hypothetical protein